MWLKERKTDGLSGRQFFIWGLFMVVTGVIFAVVVLTAAVFAAGMAFFVVMMIAADVRIEGQRSGKQCFYCGIGRAADAAVKPDTGTG